MMTPFTLYTSIQGILTSNYHLFTGPLPQHLSFPYLHTTLILKQYHLSPSLHLVSRLWKKNKKSTLESDTPHTYVHGESLFLILHKKTHVI